MYSEPFSPKQLEFIQEAEAKYNLAHGAVRTGKTVCTLFKFLAVAHECQGDTIAIFGYSQGSIYTNVISLLINSLEFRVFRPFFTWSSKGTLTFGQRSIVCIGAGDEGALGKIQGMTVDLAYCDEMTLYPEVVIDMIQTRLSKPWSKLYASMNPKQPSHKCKQWIDRAEVDKQYYALHFTLEDNPYLEQTFKDDLKASLSGLFYKRNYLGIWCLAEGAIYDFFDTRLHVVTKPPKAAEYWICGIDYGTRAPFACVLIGVNTGRFDQTGRRWWVEDEYYWDSVKTGRQKTNSEFADAVQKFIEPYAVRAIYIDPSAAAFKLELNRRGIHTVDANNDVDYGLQVTGSEMFKGNLVILQNCRNLIKEIEGYVWDSRKAEKGEDEPLKGDGIMDHACFEKNTPIYLNGSLYSISLARVGDSVMTRRGMRQVTKIHTHRSECFDYNISGRRVTCTPEHPFFTVNSGWKKVIDLIQSDILITIKPDYKWENTERRRFSNGAEENIDDIQMLQKNLKGCISGADPDICIEMFGPPQMGLYPEDTIFITSTKTHLIMLYPISNAFLPSPMQSDIEKVVDMGFQTNVGKHLLDGISRIKEGNGIEGRPLFRDLEGGNPEHVYVSNVGHLMKLENDLKASFVQISVSLPGGVDLVLMMSAETAYFAANGFLKTNMQKQNFALDLVPRKPVGKKRVYNLSVEEDEEYFAQGLLVHNCDALRYAIATHKVSKTFEGGAETLGGFRRM